MLTMTATHHPGGFEALQHLECSSDDVAVIIDGEHYTMQRAEADRLETAGVEMAYLYRRGGKVLTVPVNED